MPAARPGQEPAPAVSERRAEALVDLYPLFLRHFTEAPIVARHQHHVSVIVGLPDLGPGGPGRLADGSGNPGNPVVRPGSGSCAPSSSPRAQPFWDSGSTVRMSPALWAALVVRNALASPPPGSTGAGGGRSPSLQFA